MDDANGLHQDKFELCESVRNEENIIAKYIVRTEVDNIIDFMKDGTQDNT